MANISKAGIRIVTALAVVGLGYSHPALAQGGSAGAREAYGYTVQCYLANMTVALQSRQRGDSASADAYEMKAKRSFNAAYALGGGLGMSHDAVGADLDRAEKTDFPRMVRDSDYLAKTVAICKGTGLM